MSSSPSSEPADVFEVETIEKKKITANGKVMYFIKWKDYPPSENTWEPVENLECQDLINEFEEKEDKIVEDEQVKRPAKKKQQTSKTPSISTQKKPSNRSTSQTKINGNQKTGSDEGLTVENILGATDAAGELMFLIKWKERNEASLISSKIANVMCPQQVIAYLEQKITFVNDN